MTGAEDDAALGELLRVLARRRYRFVTPTPATHARVLARPDRREARSVEDVLGWSLPYDPGIDAEVEALLDRAGATKERDGRRHATVRVSSLHDRLFLHSAYPTDAQDSVFFGPDSYRFADLIRAELTAEPVKPGAHIVDIGAGAGVGAVIAALASPGARVTMTDVNPKALRLARINAAALGIKAEYVEGDTLDGVADPIDLALANPPYMIDEGERAYRDGGGMHGGQVSFDMAHMAAQRLAPGGRMILYTGSAIVRGEDELRTALEQLADEQDFTLRYREIDPDVFGEELESEAYRDVDRIALVAAVFTKAG